MVTIRDLLCKGYFPRELPPPFTTETFATYMFLGVACLPKEFDNAKITSICQHNVVRTGTLRRKLGIPNPVNYFQVCKEIAGNWTQLCAHVDNSKISVSKPTIIDASERALSPMMRPKALPSLRAFRRPGARYLLRTDISNFYGSIYTHSIPWALHGKLVAKAQKGATLLGNRLDALARNGQWGQTIGLPIGPDASLLLSEILLTSADVDLSKSLSRIRGFRYIDDYELCFQSLSEAELALNEIESVLSHYELGLNPQKTKIDKLPLGLEDDWAITLKYFYIRSPQRGQYSDLINFFSKAFDLAKQNPESSVLKYAIARFRSTQIDEANWPLFQSLLLQCVNSEPGTLPYAFEHYVRYSNAGYTVDIGELEEIVNGQIQYHAPLGHGSEVAWCLWGALAFDVPLHSETGEAVTEMEDSVVALLALDAENRGLFKVPLDKDSWLQFMTVDNLFRDQWLLSYEANVKGWLPSKECADHVDGDPCFKDLKVSGVSFYDPSKGSKVVPGATLPIPGGDFYQ